MKQIILILILMTTAIPGAARKPPEDGTRSAQAVQKVTELERKWAEAMKRRDIRTLDLILAADYRDTSSKGVVRNKAEEIAQFKEAAPTFITYDPDEIDVRVYGSVAVVTGRLKVKVLYENREVAGEFRYTRMYVKRRGRWQAVASQTTQVPE